MSSNNPLQRYFRQPAIYVRLPSGGKYYPEGTIDIPPNGELPVYPMTAVDEITYRTPDALFNGSAVVDVIKSCVPNIKDPWSIPAMDVDTILVAIRIASYGNDMEIETTCPHCKTSHEFGLDLRSVLDRMKSPNYDTPLKEGDVEIYFRPMTYRNLNDNNKVQFEEQKILQLIPDSTLGEAEKLSAMNDALKKLTSITFQALAQSIASVKTPDALVSESKFIVEMLEQSDRRLFAKIRDHIINIKSSAEIQPLNLNCSDCKKDYEQILTLDMTSFFGDAS